MVSEGGRRRLLSVSLAASALAALMSGSALVAAALAWPLAGAWLRAARPSSAALLGLLAADAALALAVAVRSALLALASRARATPRRLRLLHPVSAHLVCLLLPSVLFNLAVVVWCVAGMALSPRLSRSRLLWAALAYFETAEARDAMDEAQSALECCGYDGPADWHPWANDPIGRLGLGKPEEDAADVVDKAAGLGAGATGKRLVARPADSDIPESCCVPELEAAGPAVSGEDGRGTATVACRTWERGCFKPLSNALVLLHLTVGTACLVLAAMLSLVAATLRLAQTSARAALEAGDADGPAPAWLFRAPRTSTHDAVAMTSFSDHDGPGDPGGPGRPARRRPRSKSPARRGRNPFDDSDSDPDHPDKVLFDRRHPGRPLHGSSEKPTRIREMLPSPSSTTSIDSSLTFDLTETPLPTSEERFILAEYAYSLGPSPGTSTTSSWISEAGSMEASVASAATSHKRRAGELRRVRSEGDVSRVPVVPVTTRTRPTPPTARLVGAEACTPGDHDGHLEAGRPCQADGASARASALLRLEEEASALMLAAAAPPTTTSLPRPPARMTSDSSTQTRCAGPSMLRLDELFREHGILSRTQSRSSGGGGDTAQQQAVVSAVELFATASNSAASQSESVRRGASTEVNAEAEASSTAPDASLPPIPDNGNLSDLGDSPLPPPPSPRAGRRRHGPRAPHTSSSDSEANEVGGRRPPRLRPRTRPRARRGSPGLEAVALWVHDTRRWLRPHDAAGSGDSLVGHRTTMTSSTTAKTTSSSSSSSAPDAGLPPPSSSASSSAAPPSRSSSSLRTSSCVVECEETAESAVVPLFGDPRRPPEASPEPYDSTATCLVPFVDAVRPPQEVSVTVCKSSVVVALRGGDRRALYWLSLPWLLSELGLRPVRPQALEEVKTLASLQPVRFQALEEVKALASPVVVQDHAVLSVLAAFRALPSVSTEGSHQGEDALASAKTPAPPPPPTPPMISSSPTTWPRGWSRGDTSLEARVPEVSKSAPGHSAERLGPPWRRGRSGVAVAGRWSKRSRRRAVLALRDLLWSPSGTPHLADGPPAQSVSDSAASWTPSAMVNPLALRASAPSAPSPGPAGSSTTTLTLDRRKGDSTPTSPASPPPPVAPEPAARGSKRTRSEGAMPPLKLQAVMPASPPARDEDEDAVERVPLRRTAASVRVGLASPSSTSSSDQCPLCDCWRCPGDADEAGVAAYDRARRDGPNRLRRDSPDSLRRTSRQGSSDRDCRHSPRSHQDSPGPPVVVGRASEPAFRRHASPLGHAEGECSRAQSATPVPAPP